MNFGKKARASLDIEANPSGQDLATGYYPDYGRVCCIDLFKTQ